jgi:hypothetical protein
MFEIMRKEIIINYKYGGFFWSAQDTFAIFVRASNIHIGSLGLTQASTVATGIQRVRTTK